MASSIHRKAGGRIARRRLLMALPVLTPSGVYQIRRKVPPELVPVLGREYKRSLKTRNPEEAKARFAEEWTRSEAAFALAWAQQGGAGTLTARDIELLAGGWYQAQLASLEASGNFLSQLPTVESGPNVTPDGFGIWLAARRLHQGKFIWPRSDTMTQMTLSRAQLDALVLGLPWARIGEGSIITVV